MTKEEIKNQLSAQIPELNFPEIASQFLNASCQADALLAVAEKLKPEFDFLFCQTAVDWPEKNIMEVIYHLRSTKTKSEFVLRVSTSDRENPIVPTVSFIWPTAEFHEREIFDLFGIKFTGHPDLRRIFLEDDWVGYPLRKDYVDNINIVEL